ncbi:MAG TPA: IS982 family transposase [Chlamydiales bacterium]|nr:IS982 family transposase [Chlamydiales bacterium]
MYLTKKTPYQKRSKTEDLTALFRSVDDFWQQFESDWTTHLIGLNRSRRGPKPELSVSEMIKIVILLHQSNYRTFKHFYQFVATHLRSYFPQMITYYRFVASMKNLFIPIFANLMHRAGKVTGIAFIDATSTAVCHNKRIRRNKVFRGFAKRGKTKAGWFYGFKLHLVINELGEIISFLITPGNVADIAVVEQLTKKLIGQLYGDKAYISQQLACRLIKRGLQLFTTIRSNMKQKLISLKDKALLRKRAIIETVNDQLKNISQIEHKRHRSVSNFLINLLAGLVAYSHQAKKPSLNLNDDKNYLMLAT